MKKLFLLVLLLALTGCQAPPDTQPFDPYGIYRQGEQLAGPSLEELGDFYFVFCPGTAFTFWADSPAPPDVPLFTAYTDYPELPYDAAGLADAAAAVPQGQTVRVYDLGGDTLYAVGEELWIARQIGLAKGGVLCVYPLEPVSEEVFSELFETTYETLCAWEEP